MVGTDDAGDSLYLPSAVPGIPSQLVLEYTFLEISAQYEFASYRMRWIFLIAEIGPDMEPRLLRLL